ncbi:microtubule integrity protein mal3 [Coemansia sp. RSA 552]|nr:microtubule integrity protein mal3 [Coemansia sp. RSA 552]
MGSRQELIAWVNGLLQTNYTKVEQLGTGSAYCQIIDSIFQDVRLERVKFNANQEYEYVENFKVLQNAMKKHKIDKPVDPTRLVKCRFQDNFEFIQWLKRYWDAYSPGTKYDAVGRRNGKPAGPVDGTRPLSSASSSSAGAYRSRPVPRAAASRPPIGVRGAVGRPGSRTMGASAQQVQDLNKQLTEAKLLIETAEKERDFYFAKLREIEVYLQQADLSEGSEVETMAKHIQNILYSTDEAAMDEIDPNAAVPGDLPDHEYEHAAAAHMENLRVDEEETF